MKYYKSVTGPQNFSYSFDLAESTEVENANKKLNFAKLTKNLLVRKYPCKFAKNCNEAAY